MKLTSLCITAAALCAAGLAGAAPVVHSAATPVRIGDLSAASSTIHVDSHGSVRDIDVLLHITHAYDADLVLSLSHAGLTVLLSNRNGGSGGADYAGTRFDDSAAMAIDAGDAYAPYAGAFRPQQALSAFNGHDIFGAWTLTAVDMEAGDSGMLNQWSLVAEVPEPAPLAMFGAGLAALAALRRRR